MGNMPYWPNEGRPKSGGDLLLPVFTNQYFHASGRCDGCHGHDPTAQASVDALGNDISPVEFWRSTMMANAAKDPFWKAKVRHEVLINPQHRSALEDKCASCHAPMGRYTYHLSGAGPFPMDSLRVDSLAMDGVSCMSCHRQDSIGLENNHSGTLHFMPQPMEFGPYEKPFQAAMQNFDGLTPYYSPHINKAALCAGCHSLITNTVDLSGNLTGTTFVEQATYHEWKNSYYSQTNPNITCQTCHLPRISDPVRIAANIAFLPYRSPYPLHQLVGANTFMLRLMRANIDSLGIIAAPSHFDRTLLFTEDQLRLNTAEFDLNIVSVSDDTARFTVRILNKAGHKFPSGYPTRRAVIQFEATKPNGDVLFASGLFDNQFKLVDEDATFEPHHNTIKQAGQVQIYEMVMGDVSGQVTHVLERAATHLKDNRIAPAGFTATHASYDTTQIVGHALTDLDFNHEGGLEGSGTDVVHYHIPLQGYEGTINVRARLVYQSISPRSLDGMFAFNQTDIVRFKAMYEAADRTPFVIKSDSLIGIEVSGLTYRTLLDKISVYPNPSTLGIIRLHLPSGINLQSITVVSGEGKRVEAEVQIRADQAINIGPLPKGTYYIVVETDRGRVVRKAIVLN